MFLPDFIEILGGTILNSIPHIIVVSTHYSNDGHSSLQSAVLKQVSLVCFKRGCPNNEFLCFAITNKVLL